MLRRIVKVVSGLSLVLCIGTCILWLSSERPAYPEIDRLGEREYRIASSQGMVFIEQHTFSQWSLKNGLILGSVPAHLTGEILVPISPNVIWKFYHPAATQWFPHTEFAGFGWDSDDWWESISPNSNMVYTITRKRLFTVPYWFLVILLLILPIRELRRWERIRSRIRAKQCPVCGYDLRATPGRCPECGTVPAGRAKA